MGNAQNDLINAVEAVLATTPKTPEWAEAIKKLQQRACSTSILFKNPELIHQLNHGFIHSLLLYCSRLNDSESSFKGHTVEDFLMFSAAMYMEIISGEVAELEVNQEPLGGVQ